MSWQKVKLEEVAATSKYPIGDGDHGSIKPSQYLKEGIPYIRVADMSWSGEILEDSMAYISEEVNDLNPKSKLYPGDIIISKTGATIGKIAIIPDRYQVANTTASIGKVTLNKEIVCTRYVFWALKHEDFQRQMWKVSIKSAQPGFNVQDLKKFLIPLPPLNIQQKIAAILDKADELRKKDQQLLGKYDELLQSIFYDMFGDPVKNEKGWEKMNGEEYSEKLTVGVVIKPASYYVEKGVIALRSLNIRPNEIILDNLVYFSREANRNQLNKSILNENDVVIVRTGATGTAAIIPKTLAGCNCIDLIIVRPNKILIHPIYLSFFFNSDFGKALVSGKEVGGIQKHFNIGAIKALKIPTPSIELQNKFATIAQNIQEQKKQVKQQIEQSENLFQSLLQKAFKGELVK